MQFLPESRVLVLGTKDCTACFGRGGHSTRIPCPGCKGTGNGPKGGKGRCRTCYGSGNDYDQVNRTICTHCGGNPEGKSAETFTDAAPLLAVMSLPIRVQRQDRHGTWNEGYLGLGYLWSSTDYGQAWEQDDAAVLKNVQDRLAKDRTQACKILRPYDPADDAATLVDELVIVLHRDGYAIQAAVHSK